MHPEARGMLRGTRYARLRLDIERRHRALPSHSMAAGGLAVAILHISGGCSRWRKGSIDPSRWW